MRSVGLGNDDGFDTFNTCGVIAGTEETLCVFDIDTLVDDDNRPAREEGILLKSVVVPFDQYSSSH
jgi:hypothetical protein